MRTYLRIINPIVSLLILLICIYSSIMDEGVFKPGEPLEGGIPTYFIAKGLFCSATLFLVGKILQEMLFERPSRGGDRKG